MMNTVFDRTDIVNRNIQPEAPLFKNAADKKKIEETATSFEAFFMSRMMESMFEGISTNGLFGGGNAEKIYRSMLLDEYGKSMARTGSIGIKDYVMTSILEMQEMESKGYIEAKGGYYGNK